MKTETECACGGQFPADAAWCPRCFARRPVEPATAAAFLPNAVSPPPVTFGSPTPLAPRPSRRTTTGRFASTEASFGLAGRIVCTILLLIPLAFFIYLATQLIGIGGIVIYGGVICPWALRDLWKDPGRG